MAHFSHTQETRKTTPYQWLSVGRDIGKLVNTWAFRNDLIVNLGTELQDEAPAFFNPASAEIEINTARVFPMLEASEVGNLNHRKCQLTHSVASGAIFHEALHARVTRWSLEEAFNTLSPEDYKAMHHLEESRIEAFGVKYHPENQVLLRSSAMEIVLADLDQFTESLASAKGAGFLCALTLARVDAGVLEQSDVEPVMELIEEILSVEVLEKLRSVWTRFQAHSDHANPLPLYELAKEWNQILNERAEERGDNDGKGEGQPGEGKPFKGEPQDGDAKGEGGDSEMVKRIMEALEDARDFAKIAVQDSLDDSLDAEEAKEELERRAEQAKESKEAKSTASDVFGRGTGPSPASATRSTLIESRKPSAEERVAAVTVAKMLDKAKYRERSQTVIKSVTPPGRLRTRALVQGQALKSRGVQQQTEAWRRTQRKHTDDPTLNIGVMVDISGSMRAAMNPMAITAWVMSEATRRVQGKSAMVYYGQDVFATLKPGQHLENINVYTAKDSTEEFDKAFKALDGSLNLLHGTDGAKLLVVVSDGYYRDDQRERAKHWFKQCQRNGVAVVFITYDGGGSAQRLVRGTDAQVVNLDANGDPRTAATIIGEAAASALTKVGQRNG